MGVCGLLCKYVLPSFILTIALIVGWILQGEIPEGRIFAALYPIMRGSWPPSIVGHGKMEGTPPVPDDMKAQPRPERESFVELVDGHKMPQNGIGMCCRPTAYDDVLVERTTLWYLLLGGRLIDTAHVYLNHRAIGKGIMAAEQRDVPREEIFLTTKLFPSFYGYNTTMETVPKWLDQLGVEYLDLVLMHAPLRFPGIEYICEECKALKLSKAECRAETWKALSKLKEQGIIRSIGVSNFNVNHMKQLQSLQGVSKIAVNQFQFGPWSPDSAYQAFEHCQETGVVVTAYNSLGSYTHKNVTHDFEVLKELGKKHGKSVAQILLRWAIQLQAVVIPGTGNPKHMKENLEVYNFELSPEDMTSIQSLRSEEHTGKFLIMDVKDFFD